MDKINIAPTKTTPEVSYDEELSTLTISGHSYPENSVEFYQPILEWIKKWVGEKPEKLRIVFKLEYFNTSSSKSLLDVFDLLEEAYLDELKIKVEWHYQKDDDDMKDSGEDFAEDLSVPIDMVPYD